MLSERSPHSSAGQQDYSPFKWKNVLCWVGSIDEVEQAVELARVLASAKGGECHVVMGLDSPHWLAEPLLPGTVLAQGGQAPLTPEVISKAERRLADLYPGDMRTMVLPGHPITEVLRYARRHQMDIIVVGEQGAAVEAKYGERLVDHAPCTVIIVIPPNR